MNIELHIERLVLNGVAMRYVDRDALQAVVEQELTRLLRLGSIAPQLRTGGAMGSVQGGNIDWPRQPKATLVGAQIAQAVYRSLGSGDGGK